MNKYKKKLLMIGIMAGIIASMSIQILAAPAIESIQAYINHEYTFEFNGITKDMPDDYELIVYKDRSYVPVRFVAENLGIEVYWDDTGKLIRLTTDTPVESSGNAIEIEKYEYKQMPQTKDDLGYRVSVLSYFAEGQNIGDRIYIGVSNNSDLAVRLDQMATKIEVEGKLYEMKPADAIDFDTRWYNDINKDQYKEGYLRLPKELKNMKELHLEITVNSGNNQGTYSQVFEFNIAL